MNKYYIIREDGSSLFMLPYPEDFIYHCLFALIDTGERFSLLRFAGSSELQVNLKFSSEFPFPYQRVTGL